MKSEIRLKPSTGGVTHLSRRAVVIGLGLGHGAGLLAACSVGAGAKDEKPAASQVTGTVRYAHWWADQTGADEVNAAVAAFNEQQGGRVRVEVDSIRWGGPVDYAAKIVTQFAAGSQPDALRTTFQMVPDVAKQGMLLDLGSVLKRDAREVQPDDFYPAGLEAGQHEGKQYGIADASQPGLLIYYNEDVVRRLGLEPPDVVFEKGRWTYDVALDYGKRMTLRDGDVITRPGFAIGPLVNYPAEAIVWGHGGTFFSEDGKQATLNSAQTLEGLTWYVDRAQRDRITQFGIAPGKNITNDVIVQGDIGMVSWNSNYGVTLKARGATWPWNVAPFPAGPRTGSGPTSGGFPNPDGLGAPARNLEAAWLFLKWYYSKDTLNLRRKAARRSMRDKSIEYSDNLADRSGARHLAAATEKTRVLQRPAGNTVAIQDAITKGLNAMLNGQTSVRDGAESLTREINEMLRSAP